MSELEDTGSNALWAELRSQRDILIEMRTLLKQNTQTKDDHESRLRKLEERKFPLPTIAVIVATLSLVATVVMFAITNLK